MGAFLTLEVCFLISLRNWTSHGFVVEYPLGIVIPDSSADAMDTSQVVNTQVEADVAVSQPPNVDTPSNKPHDGLLGDFGCGRSFSQVKIFLRAYFLYSYVGKKTVIKLGGVFNYAIHYKS